MLEVNRRLRAAATVLSLAISPAAFAAFDAQAARAKLQRVGQQEIDGAWRDFEAALEAGKRGQRQEALRLLRRGLSVHPAETSAHLLGATLAEAEDVPAVALAHWEAVAALAPAGSPQARQAQGATRRLLQALSGQQRQTCEVFGMRREAFAAQCDEGVAAPAPAARPAPAVPPGLDYVHAHAYPGRRRPQDQVATVFAPDGSPRYGATFICKVDGKPVEPPASIVYLLPGTHTVGWCYRNPSGPDGEGEAQVQVRSEILYQLAASWMGPGRYSHMFREMGFRQKLTWRAVAPGKSAHPQIDTEVPYSP